MPLIDRVGPILASTGLVDKYGPVVGIIAFVGLAILAFLIFQQGREVRRLREWAGRAPERAAEADEAQVAAAGARDQGEAEPPPSFWARIRGGFAGAGSGMRERFGPRWREFDRRSPVDARIVAVLALLLVVGAIVAVTALDLFGSSSNGGSVQAAKPASNVQVAVLNGTQENGVQAVPGLASAVAHKVVKPAGYRAGPVTNAPGSFASTVVMFQPGHSAEAKALATAVKPKLGGTPTQSMPSSTQSVVGKAPLALVIGLDNSRFGQSG